MAVLIQEPSDIESGLTNRSLATILLLVGESVEPKTKRAN